MIAFLRSVQAFAFFGMMLIIMLLRLYTFGVPYAFSWETSYLPGLSIFGDFVKLNPLSFKIIEIVWVLFTAWYFNFVIEKHNILGRKTYVPAFVLGILLSSNLYFTHFGPLLILSFPLLIFIDKMLGMSDEGDVRSRLFDAGLLVSIMSSIYFPFILFVPLVLITLLNFRPFSLREIIIVLVGFILPILFISTYLFLMDKSVYEHFNNLIASIQLPSFSMPKPEQLFFILMLFIGLLFSIPKVLNSMLVNKIRIRKSYGFFFSILVFAILSLLIKTEKNNSFYFISIFPMALFFSVLILHAKRTLWLNIYVLLLISSIGIMQFYWLQTFLNN
jgi:hypothetical protein